MADRAGGEGKPGVPKEVFELDKDERWQARLDEARARREIALAERAAGKAQKPRPKPWEVDGADGEKPAVIDPVIQERGDDKFDFADRLETIREAQAQAKETPPPIAAVPQPDPEPEPEPEPEAAPEPEPEPAFDPTPAPPPVAKKPPAPELRARPQPSLILPGAPDVADIAARYAATLETPAPLTSRTPPPAPVEERAPTRRSADLVTLPTAAKPAQPPAPQPALSRRERRIGIRPLGMALALLGFAALPLTTEAPELEIGPTMPDVTRFRMQPALGITWALAEPPALTEPVTAIARLLPPPPLVPVPLERSVAVQSDVDLPPLTGPTLTGALNWSDVEGVLKQNTGDVVATPQASDAPPVALAPPPAQPAVADNPLEPTAPPPPRADETQAPPVAEAEAGPEASQPAPQRLEGVEAAPPRPPALRDPETPTPPPAPTARPTPSDTVVEAVIERDPLRVTVLAPARVERAFADDIAARISGDGHALVRIKDIDFNISTRNVRYFHEADRASAARMAERYDAELRDFTWFRPRPVEGTAELWLAGRSGAGTGNTSGRPQPSGAADRSDLLDRMLNRLGLSTELPDALPTAEELRQRFPQADN